MKGCLELILTIFVEFEPYDNIMHYTVTKNSLKLITESVSELMLHPVGGILAYSLIREVSQDVCLRVRNDNSRHEADYDGG